MVATGGEHVAKGTADEATRTGDGDPQGCAIPVSRNSVEVVLEPLVPEGEEPLELRLDTRPAEQTTGGAHGQLPIDMVLHGASASVLPLEAMRVDPSSEGSPDLLVTEEAVLLKIGVEKLDPDLGWTPPHTK